MKRTSSKLRTFKFFAFLALIPLAWTTGCMEGSYDIGTDGYYGGAPEARTDSHNDFGENQFIDAAEENTSTFSIDVNTASYTIMRRDLNAGRLPVPESVRTEEYINFFDYDYRTPQEGPFSLHTEVARSHFGSTEDQVRHLMRIAFHAPEISHEDMKPTNLVFLVDVSGSMNLDDRLPLAQKSMHVMLDYLRPNDTIAMQTYASGSDTVLEPTPVADRASIEEAIDSLVAAGATHAEGGIIDAYDMAEQAFIEGGNNRVVILTDGDFNVGKTGDDLVEMVKSYRDRQISLTSVGYGHGGYNDATMEELARRGNGNYFYIDTADEAKRIFGTDLPSTIQVIAHDVRTQVEFNADVVNQYRLVGYEKRVMDNEDFADEETNAGELGPGHSLTAFYELELQEGGLHDDAGALAEVAVRYKESYGEETKEISNFVSADPNVVDREFSEARDDFRFAAAVAQFAGILRESQYVNGANFAEIHAIAKDAFDEEDVQKQEFLELVMKASALWD